MSTEVTIPTQRRIAALDVRIGVIPLDLPCIVLRRLVTTRRGRLQLPTLVAIHRAPPAGGIANQVKLLSGNDRDPMQHTPGGAAKVGLPSPPIQNPQALVHPLLWQVAGDVDQPVSDRSGPRNCVPEFEARMLFHQGERGLRCPRSSRAARTYAEIRVSRAKSGARSFSRDLNPGCHRDCAMGEALDCGRRYQIALVYASRKNWPERSRGSIASRSTTSDRSFQTIIGPFSVMQLFSALPDPHR
jgi:hypothetical protein